MTGSGQCRCGRFADAAVAAADDDPHQTITWTFCGSEADAKTSQSRCQQCTECRPSALRLSQRVHLLGKRPQEIDDCLSNRDLASLTLRLVDILEQIDGLAAVRQTGAADQIAARRAGRRRARRVGGVVRELAADD